MEARSKSAIVTGADNALAPRLLKRSGNRVGLYICIVILLLLSATKIILAEIENQGGKGKLISADLSSPRRG